MVLTLFGLASAAPNLPLQALRPPSAGKLLGLDLDIIFDKAALTPALLRRVESIVAVFVRQTKGAS